MLKETERNKGVAGMGKPKIGSNFVLPPKNNAPTLANIGISYKQSSNWQKIAEIPEAEFEKDIAEAKEKTAICPCKTNLPNKFVAQK